MEDLFENINETLGLCTMWAVHLGMESYPVMADAASLTLNKMGTCSRKGVCMRVCCCLDHLLTCLLLLRTCLQTTDQPEPVAPFQIKHTKNDAARRRWTMQKRPSRYKAQSNYVGCIALTLARAKDAVQWKNIRRALPDQTNGPMSHVTQLQSDGPRKPRLPHTMAVALLHCMVIASGTITHTISVYKSSIPNYLDWIEEWRLSWWRDSKRFSWVTSQDVLFYAELLMVQWSIFLRTCKIQTKSKREANLNSSPLCMPWGR